MSRFDQILPFLGPIEHLVLDDSISEIMVNGSDKVFVEKNGFVSEVPGLSLDEDSLLIAVKDIAKHLGDDISESKPILNSFLRDGSRLAIVIPPCSLTGVTLTIQKSSTRRLGVDDLIEAGMLTATLARRLEEYVLNRKNILVSGGSGAGKTTLLSVLTKFIQDDDRIFLVEDRPEIHFWQHNFVLWKPKEMQNGVRSTTKRDLIEAALGHRPDRIVVGDIRGGEAFDLLELMKAGHSGILTSVHSNSALQALSRFVSCALRSGTNLPYRALKSSLADSVDVIVQIERKPGRRYVSEILEVNSYDADSDLFDYCVVHLNRQSPAPGE